MASDIVRKVLEPAKHSLKFYSRKEAIEAILLYDLKNKQMQLNLNKLLSLRFMHGTQFLIDLFVLSEVYIKHINTIDIRSLRKDITHILNQIPNYRLKYENN